MFSRKVLCSNPSIGKTILCFQKYLVRRQTGTITRDTTKFVWGGLKSRNRAGMLTNPQKLPRLKRNYETRGPAPKRTKLKPSPKQYDCPAGSAFLFVSDKRHKIKVLLDSGSNIFLLNQKTARSLKIAYEIRETPLEIPAFNGEYLRRAENIIPSQSNWKSEPTAIPLWSSAK